MPIPPLATGKIAALKSHRYFIKDDCVVIVETGGKVADIVKDQDLSRYIL